MFKTREIVGWLLVLGGLYMLLTWGMDLIRDRKVFAASVVVFAAMAVFRGGIQLIKVATAAHVCLTAEQRADSSNQT